jgi:hypothetical protein
MDNLAPGPLKPRLPARVAQGQAEQQAFIAQFSDAQRAAVGDEGRQPGRPKIISPITQPGKPMRRG